MSADHFPLDLHDVRGSDSNSLLRLYDRANAIYKSAQSQEERTRAARALRRIVDELRRRDVVL